MHKPEEKELINSDGRNGINIFLPETYLMYPRMACVTIYPAFFRQSVVLEFLQILFRYFCSIIKKYVFVRIQKIEAGLTPMVLLSAVREVCCIPLQSLHTTFTLAIKNSRFIQSLLYSAKGT
jgi:hypothetical protein